MPTHTLMHHDTAVADLTFEDAYLMRIDATYDLDHAPLGCARGGRLDLRRLHAWLDRRRIPDNRQNLRELLGDEPSTDTRELALENLYVSMCDQWWVRPKGGTRVWASVDPRRAKLLSRRPDASYTLAGSLEKRWRNHVIDEPTFEKLASEGAEQQVANEVVATRLANRLDIDCVGYRHVRRKGKRGVSCQSMVTRDEELIYAQDVLLERDVPGTRPDEAMRFYMDRMRENGLDAKGAILSMMAMDILMRNEDRRWQNFGIIRDARTLTWLRPAPVFDLGDSLWFDSKPNLEEATNRLNNHRLSDDTKHVRTLLLEHRDDCLALPDIVSAELKRIGTYPPRRESVVLATQKRVETILGICEGRKNFETKSLITI